MLRHTKFKETIPKNAKILEGPCEDNNYMWIWIQSAETTSTSEHDVVNRPSHYMFSKPAKDVLDVISECDLLDDHLIASAFAYLARCKRKGNYLQDLKKAQFYLNKGIELHESTKEA